MWSLDFVAIINSKRGSSSLWVSSEGFSFANATILETWLKRKKKTASLKLDNCEKIQYIFFLPWVIRKTHSVWQQGCIQRRRALRELLENPGKYSTFSNMTWTLASRSSACAVVLYQTCCRYYATTRMQVTLKVKHFGQLSETYGEIWNMKQNMEEAKERKEVPSIIQYKGGSKAQTPVESLITILPWSLAVTWRWFSTIRATGDTLWMNTCLMTPSRTIYQKGIWGKAVRGQRQHIQVRAALKM